MCLSWHVKAKNVAFKGSIATLRQPSESSYIGYRVAKSLLQSKLAIHTAMANTAAGGVMKGIPCRSPGLGYMELMYAHGDERGPTFWGRAGSWAGN